MQDASDALDLLEAILEYVDLFSAKFELFKERRAKTGHSAR